MINIHVLDSPVGSGRTTAMINYVNSASDNKHFIYVVSDEEEVCRIKNECHRRFYEFEDGKWKYKIRRFKGLLDRERDIVTTCALYDLFDEESMDLCSYYDYELILDDVNYLSDRSPLTDDDTRLMLEYEMDIGDNGFAKWKDESEDYRGVFSGIKNLVHMNALAVFRGYPLLWRYPVGMLKAFKNVFIVTYKFGTLSQRYYFDKFKISYDFYHIENGDISASH